MEELNDFRNKVEEFRKTVEELKAKILLKRKSEADEEVIFTAPGWRTLITSGYLTHKSSTMLYNKPLNTVQQTLKRAEFADYYSSGLTLEALQNFVQQVKTNATNKDIN